LKIRVDDNGLRRDDVRSLTAATNRLGIALVAGCAMICAVLLGRSGEIITTPTGIAVVVIALVAASLMFSRRS
jgi:hypothetical protein